MRQRRRFESGEAPEAGQVWQWDDGSEFYLVQPCGHPHAPQGEAWVSINVSTGVTEEVFFNARDQHIPWTRLA